VAREKKERGHDESCPYKGGGEFATNRDLRAQSPDAIGKLKIPSGTAVSCLSKTRQQTLAMLDTATGDMIRDLLG